MKKVFIAILISVMVLSVMGTEMEYYFDKAIGKNGKNPGEFDYPVCVSKDMYNNIYVTDWKNDRVQKFSDEGKFLLSFGNNVAPKLNKPIGIAVDTENKVYVCDYLNNRVIKYDENGNVLLTIGKKGRGKGEFRSPRGIYIDRRTNDLYVADYNNYRVQIFDQNGKYKSEIECKDPENNKKYPPRSVAVDQTGNIYAVMTSYNVVWKFSPEHILIKKFGKKGNMPGEFNNPRYITVDMLNNIYISDYENHRVQIFNTEGNCKGYFGEKGDALGKFNSPEGLYVDREAKIYIVDSENDRIQVFKPADIFKYRSMARYLSMNGAMDEALEYYKKIYDIDPDDVVAKKLILEDLHVKLKKAEDDIKIKELAHEILQIDSEDIDSNKALNMLKEKEIKAQNKKKVRLIIVLLIILIVIIILVMVLKPQKKNKNGKKIKIIIW